MGVLNEERLALYDSLIKKYCLNHNDLLTKIYEISYFNGEWCCDDDSFFDNEGNRVVIAYFAEEISAWGDDEIKIWCKSDYCWNYGRWPEPYDDFYDDKRQLYVYYNNCIPRGYTFLFSVAGSNDYRTLSHQSLPDIDAPGCDCDDTDGAGFTPPSVYTATQGWDICDWGYGFAAVQAYDLFYNQPDLFILQCDNDITVTYGIIGYPDDTCSDGYNAECSTYFKGMVNGTIPQGYNLFIKSTDGSYILISSYGLSGGGSSGTSLPSGSDGQFMVYTGGKWQGKTITVGGSY